MDRRGLAGQGSRGRGWEVFPAPKAVGFCVDTDSSCLPPVPTPTAQPGCQIFLTLLFFPQDSDMLACHNYWHWALYLIEKVR